VEPAYDLRHAWPSFRHAFRPAGDDGAEFSDSADDSPADGGPANTDTGADDIVRDAEKKKLSDEAAARRNEAKAERARADAAEAALATSAQSITELRQHNAFLSAAVGRLTDLDAAWKLADASQIVIAEDGTPTGTDDVITGLLERYPYLAPVEPLEPFQPLPTLPSGRPLNGRKLHQNEPTRHVLEGKFPALKRNR
jgi:hypothetical protein